MTQSPSQSPRNKLIVRNDFSPFGNKLIQSGYIDPEKMRQAMAESRKSKRSLIDVLETMTGQPMPPELLRHYKKQQLFELKILYGVESLDPEIKEIDSLTVASLIESLVPLDICRRSKLLPVDKNDQAEPPVLLVAMVDPDNLSAQDDLNRILRPLGITLQRMVIGTDDYQKLISTYLDAKVEQEKAKESEKAMDVSRELEGLDGLDLAEDDFDSTSDDLGSALEGANEGPIVNMVNKILAKALQDRVSDIHIEPQEDYLRVRYRKDGVLQEYFSLPKKIAGSIATRFKIMSDLDIAERRKPQDGKIRRMFQGRKVDFRVNCLPSRYGEKIVLRILDNSATQLGLDKLITDQETLSMVRETASRPFGLILVTGPTGSGKSTSLYSILAERNDPGVNISTAEDPIEYALPGITQVQVIREKDVDFPAILRAFMRQDPDVILVGETRDKETAKTAIEAALTGHLVLTTLHTNDAAGAIARLDEMGVEPFMVSGALLGVLAQRLMRRVCSECKIPYNPTIEELGRFGLSASQEGEITVFKANTLDKEQIAAAKARNTLCKTCGGGGYKGRVGVYEFMKITERLQELINRRAPTAQIKEAAVEEGMKTLLAYSLELVMNGYTTFDEVERVTFTDSGLEAELKAKRKATLTCRTCNAELQQDWLDCPYCMTPRFQD